MSLVAGAVALTACASTPTVGHNADPVLHTSTYRTYRVVSDAVNDPTSSSPEAAAVVNHAIHRIMRARGFVRSEAKTVDLLVTFAVAAAPVGVPAGPTVAEQVAMIPSPGDGAIFGDLIPFDVEPPRQVDKQIVVRLQDAKTMQVVWSGWARHRMNADRVVTGTSDIVLRILTRLPHRS